MTRLISTIVCVCLYSLVDAFVLPSSSVVKRSGEAVSQWKNPTTKPITTTPSARNRIDAATNNALTLKMMIGDVSSLASETISSDWALLSSSSTLNLLSMLPSSTSSLLMSFVDQGQNLAGIFFQASLLPYILFLYFLSFRANRIPPLANFGFQFVLIFVLATIPSGIISKSTYGTSLANVDWLHGGAEFLLTVANILLVVGFLEGSNSFSQTDTNTTPSTETGTSLNIGRVAAFSGAAIFAAACALGPSMGLEAHSPFLTGLGDLSNDAILSLPWVTHSEPINALSIPTWAIHFSSVLEFLVAMNLVWKFSQPTQNESWKGLTWGMLPLHASGICACVYHFFYNPSALQFLVTMQAAFTCLGNITCAIAAFRIAKSNGWTLQEINPIPTSNTSPQGLIVDELAVTPLMKPVISSGGNIAVTQEESKPILAAKLIGLTVVLSYLVKYGELGIDLPFTPNGPVALGLVLGIPLITASSYVSNTEISNQLPLTESFPLSEVTSKSTGSGTDAMDSSAMKTLGEGGSSDAAGSLSMADIKKYGVAGTVAYVLTELAFWIVAFPVASTALYQTTGHWPDIINDTADRATVLGFIFAGANVARLLVPLRLGAALALAPWVDENLLNREATSNNE
jgi:Protein of unknown function (DUF2499)/Protein of unknown function (DUF3593)